MKVGFVIKADSKELSISGDTEFTLSLVNKVKSVVKEKLHAAFIDINERFSNMTVDEAVEAALILQPPVAIPMHYEMFAENTGDPLLFVEKSKKNQILAKQLFPGKEMLI